MSLDVAAVLAEGLCGVEGVDHPCSGCRVDVGVALAALTAAGYAVVALPEGVAVAHGAKLNSVGWLPALQATVYTFEDAP